MQSILETSQNSRLYPAGSERLKSLSGEDRNALTVPSRFHKLLIFPEVHHVVERDRKESHLKATSQADTDIHYLEILRTSRIEEVR